MDDGLTTVVRERRNDGYEYLPLAMVKDTASICRDKNLKVNKFVRKFSVAQQFKPTASMYRYILSDKECRIFGSRASDIVVKNHPTSYSTMSKLEYYVLLLSTRHYGESISIPLSSVGSSLKK